MKNFVNITGRIGNQLELKTINNNIVLNFSLAVNKKKKEMKDGQETYIDDTDWFSISAFNNIAELITKHFKRGDQIEITGELHQKKFKKDGEQRSVVEVLAKNLEFTGCLQKKNKDNLQDESLQENIDALPN